MVHQLLRLCYRLEISRTLFQDDDRWRLTAEGHLGVSAKECRDGNMENPGYYR